MATPRLIAIAGTLALVLASQSQAGILADASNTFAFDDGSTLYKGSRAFFDDIPFFETLDASLDFSVFAPGQFQSFLNANGITGAGYVDPSPIDEYVYAYQVLDNGSTAGVTTFTLGLDGDEPITIPVPNQVPLNAFTVNPPSVVASSTDTFVPNDTQANWFFDFGDLSGVDSTILFFSSTAPPEADRASLVADVPSQTLGPNDGIPPDQLTPPLSDEWLPSPSVPEPASMALFGVGFAILASRRR